MFTAKTYFLATSLDDAYEMLQRNKSNIILGGCGWLKMQQNHIWTAIDLTRISLNQILETPDSFHIGCMVTLRQLENYLPFQTAFGGILSSCVKPIVGIQFRNMATVGGSVYMRAGFSDLLTALSALDCDVVLHHAGKMSLEAFLTTPKTKRDILTKIIVYKTPRLASYRSFRNTATDFPILTVCVSKQNANDWRVVVGARPALAQRCPQAEALLAKGNLQGSTQSICEQLTYHSNLRASKAYRCLLAQELFTRAASELL